MWQYMTDFFSSGFIFPGISWYHVLFGISLGIIFGAIWYAAYWTDILKKPWAWAIFFTSIILTWISVSFIQIPLQIWTGRVLNYFWSEPVLFRWLLLAGIPQILFSGLVQEGSKLVPVVIFWWKKEKNITPLQGLLVGAVAGLGFGVFEAIWVHLNALSSGLTWETIQLYGILALVPFIERFFVIAFHTASTAIAGWGLARGWGWQFYLITSFTHAIINYSAVLIRSGKFNQLQMEIFIITWALAVTAASLWLRYRKPKREKSDS